MSNPSFVSKQNVPARGNQNKNQHVHPLCNTNLHAPLSTLELPPGTHTKLFGKTILSAFNYHVRTISSLLADNPGIQHKNLTIPTASSFAGMLWWKFKHGESNVPQEVT